MAALWYIRIMKSINIKIIARFTIHTTKLNVKIHYESAEVSHNA